MRQDRHDAKISASSLPEQIQSASHPRVRTVIYSSSSHVAGPPGAEFSDGGWWGANFDLAGKNGDGPHRGFVRPFNRIRRRAGMRACPTCGRSSPPRRSSPRHSVAARLFGAFECNRIGLHPRGRKSASASTSIPSRTPRGRSRCNMTNLQNWRAPSALWWDSAQASPPRCDPRHTTEGQAPAGSIISVLNL